LVIGRTDIAEERRGPADRARGRDVERAAKPGQG
jgi:hypothetical protein